LIRCGHTPVSVSGVDSVTNSTLINDTHSLYRISITCLLYHNAVAQFNRETSGLFIFYVGMDE
jgi:hypothetical protein